MTEDKRDDADELRAFIGSTLSAIMDAVSDIQPSAQAKSAFGTGTYAFNVPREVSFDIAVSAERSGSKKGGFEVKVLSFGANAGADTANKNSTVSRIKFTVPTGFKSQRDDGPLANVNWKSA